MSPVESDDDYRNRVEAGLLVAFEYPVRPQVRTWLRHKILSMLANQEKAFEADLRSILDHAADLTRISMHGSPDGVEPYWNNGWFPPLDSMHLYSLLARNRPRLYMEVGSGNSTKFAARAIRDLGLPTKIVSLDPCPRAEVDALCFRTVRHALENVDVGLFDELGPGDLLFVDNSHVGLQGSDVTVFITEILPRLKDGVIWGVHDIFLPFDYPEEWTHRYYNEQYYLMSYLLGGADTDSIVFATNYVGTAQCFSPLRAEIQSAFPDAVDPEWLGGGAFWMRRGGNRSSGPASRGAPT